MHVPLYRRLAAKISALSVLLVVLTIAYFAVAIFLRDYRILERHHGSNLQRIVEIAAQQIDGAQHDRLRSPQDQKTPLYAKLQHTLKQVQVIYKLPPSQLYTLRVDEKGALYHSIQLGKGAAPGTSYKLPAGDRNAFRRVRQNKKATHTRMKQDTSGMWVTAYAPILSKDQRIVGVLVGHLQIDRFYILLFRDLRWLLLLSLTAVLLALLLSLTFAQRLNKDLDRLTQGVEAIKLHDYNYHIDLQRQDELGVLARQFNEMADVISERIDMLKYLPKHTLEAIARRSRTGTVHEVEYIKGTVVFTDLRGTASQQLSPEQLIEVLNKYLRTQAERFDHYGGEIDKLVGDGVIAVFKEFAHIHRAVEAALDVQKVAAELNDSEEISDSGFEMGVGVATGYLVFGEIGSELRKERVLLGAEVTLASRLANLAAAGEVLVSDQVRHQLGKSLDIAKTSEVDIKGFEEKQIVHSVSAIGAFASQKTWTV